MPRALIIVLDSVGIGGAEDAAAYGDAGADTVGHIAEACARGRGRPRRIARGSAASAEPRRARPRPCLRGLDRAAAAEPRAVRRARRAHGATASRPRAARTRPPAIGRSPACRSTSTGAISRTPSRRSRPSSRPRSSREAQLPGILGDRHASGTAILDELGAEHIRTGKPICYTSVDSVFQIAAHEEAFGLERLYEVCRVARRLCDRYRIGRVIARPFLGSPETGFTRTPQPQGLRRPRRPPTPSSTSRRRPAAPSSRSARSATSSPIAAPARR